MKNKNNYYDNISVDIDKLFDECSVVRKRKRKTLILRLFTRYLSALLIKLQLYEVLVEIGIIKKWFIDFKEYWTTFEWETFVPHDFYNY